VPRKVFVAGEILTAADVNTNLMDQAVQRFADSTARGSAIPSPTEGMTSYLDDLNRIEVYNGTAWGAVGTILQVVGGSTTTQVLTTSSTFQDTGLTATITPTATTSKIIVLVGQAVGAFNASGTNAIGRFQTLRDSTVISSGSTAYNVGMVQIGSGNIEIYSHYAVAVVDSPASVSPLTYKTQMRISTGSVIAQQNGAGSSITLMEVAA
jgi:hypothetical protein